MPRSSVPPPCARRAPSGAPAGAVRRRVRLTCEPVDEGLLNRGYRFSTTRGRYFLKHDEAVCEAFVE